jgi:predicted nucleotide-binding protein
MFDFLRAAGVQPIEWAKAIQYSGSASPHVSEILEAAFAKAQAVVVMMTPDDEAKLRDEFIRKGDGRQERKLTPQARANVIFEAGMAFGTHSKQTVLVEFGKLRPISDTIGRHAVRMDNSNGRRKELLVKLQNAGCEVDFIGSDWESAGDFTL